MRKKKIFSPLTLLAVDADIEISHGLFNHLGPQQNIYKYYKIYNV